MKLNKDKVLQLAKTVDIGSQTQLADKLCINRSTLYRRFDWQTWTAEQIFALAYVLDVHHSELTKKVWTK